MATPVSINIRKEAALARIAAALDVDTTPGSKDPAVAQAVLLERIADAAESAAGVLDDTRSALARAEEAAYNRTLADALSAASDEEWQDLGIAATTVAKLRAAAEAAAAAQEPAQ